MLACVCQPSDTGIFRRSPVPLGAPPLKINRGAIPKPGRTLRLSSQVITSEPNSNKNKKTNGNERKTESVRGRSKLTTKGGKCDEKCNVESQKNDAQGKEVIEKKSGLLQKVWECSRLEHFYVFN